MRVVSHWHRLRKEAVDCPSQEVFRSRLDGSSGNLVWWMVCHPWQEELQLDSSFKRLIFFIIWFSSLEIMRYRFGCNTGFILINFT